MNTSWNRRVLSLAAALLITLVTGQASSDETEIFTGSPTAVSSGRPNILFIFDTSGSMSGEIETIASYDPNGTYTGDCRADRVYYRSGTSSNTPPSCGTSNWVPLSSFKCQAGLTAMGTAGYYTDRAARWRTDRNPRYWGSLSAGSSQSVECQGDAGRHGDGVNTSKLWAADGNTNGPWTSNSAQAITWTQHSITTYTFYSAKYLNWYNDFRVVTRTRLEIVQEVAIQTIQQLAEANTVNAALMRYSSNTTSQCSETSAEGGMVLRAMDTIANNSAGMQADIAGFTANGCTPLSETMFEAYRYLSGGAVKFGLNSKKSASGSVFPSVAASREAFPNSNNYKSPLLDSCQRNFIVLLTDGLPTADKSADTDIQALLGRQCVDSMSGQTWSGKNTGDGRCLDEIARYMYENDLRPNTPGTQNATTYTIGFGPDVAAGTSLLQNTASGAGGQYYTAGDTAELTVVLTDIIRNILNINTTFTAPAVSVNAFNRTQNLNDLYLTVFKPSETYAWPGNLKKYHLAADGTILDANDNPAVDLNTGFFRTTSRSYWTAGQDDADNVAAGGAANVQPAPADRNVYSNLSSTADLSAIENQVTVGNTTILASTLGLVPDTTLPGRDGLISWLRGADVDDEDGDGDTTEPRLQMGDPMHGRPSTVIYGGTTTAPDQEDGVIFATTNEGFLHAIDVNDGSELWAFMPRELLGRAAPLYQDGAINSRVWGLDGNVRLYKYDVNDDGIVDADAGDRVLVFFGMRRGGSSYYGLDVTDRNAPQLLWKVGPTETGSKLLAGGGQSWSTPTVARVAVSGATQNSLKLVLVFGGGYDTVQDNGPYATDSSGNRIFMIDALSGNVLWYAGNTSSGADLVLSSMSHGIPSDVRVLDITGDGYADRMYAADMGGRIWRFDITSGNARSALVTGGVFASLGNAHLSTHPATSNRRFYAAPDLAFLSAGGRNWLNIAIGSGYRGHPLDLGTQDRFYSLRDHTPYAKLTQTQYNSLAAITEADTNLIDVSTDITTIVPRGATGWRFDLKASGSWTGEKALAEARTFQNVIQFPTYEPNNENAVNSTSCTPALGTNRLYSVSAFTGAPVTNRDDPADPPDAPSDRLVRLEQGGIAPEVVWLFPSPDNPAECVGQGCRPPPVCLVGLESCGTGTSQAPVRTFWRQTGVN